MLFPLLRCAVRLRPGLVLVFQGIEPHRVTPLVPLHDPTAPLPPGYDDDTRIKCILYPKHDIHNATRLKTLPEDARPPGQLPQTPANLVEHSRASFGSRCQQSCWTKHEMLHSMRRIATSLVPRRRVDFAALSAAVHLPWRARQRNSGGGQGDRCEHDDEDFDDEHPDADESAALAASAMPTCSPTSAVLPVSWANTWRSQSWSGERRCCTTRRRRSRRCQQRRL